MKFSLLVPTRDRPAGLARLLDSIYKTTTKKKNIEVLIAVDEDDPGGRTNVSSLIAKYGNTMNVQMHLRERTEMLNRDYYNWLANKATGDMLWILADDLILMRYDWDGDITNALNHFFEHHPDRVVCCNLRDNTPPPSHRLPKFPCFPMFSKECREATGWLLHPKVPNWGADYISYCIYRPIGRLLDFQEHNYVNHVSHHNKQIRLEDIDSTQQRIGNIFNKLKMIPEHNTDRILAEEVQIIRGQLTSYIKGKEYSK